MVLDPSPPPLGILWSSPPNMSDLTLVTSTICVMSFMCDMTRPSVTWIHLWYGVLIYDMTHAYVTWIIHMEHDSFIWDVTRPSVRVYSCVTRLIHMSHDSSTCYMTHPYVTWLVCDMTHWYVTWLILVWHDSSLCDMTHSMWHDSFICDLTHSYVSWLVDKWNDSFISTWPSVCADSYVRGGYD